jgi:hypothetical protein
MGALRLPRQARPEAQGPQRGVSLLRHVFSFVRFWFLNFWLSGF